MRRIALAGALVLATAACAPAGAGPAAAPTPRPTLVMPTGSPTAEQAELRARAVEVLARWDAVADTGDRIAVIAYGGPGLGGWTGSAGEWAPALRNSAKMASVTGMVVAATALPTEAPPPGTVVWSDGRRQDAGVMSAADGLRAVQGGKIQDCAECVPLRVTGARLGTARLDTVRGEATAPAWEFTVEGTAGLLTRVAIAPADVRPIPPLDTDNPHFPRLERAAVDATGLRLTSTFFGAIGDRSQTCGADYTSEAVESTHAVVVIVYEHRKTTATKAVGCPAIGKDRAVTNTLATPLDDRAVIELNQGVPVTVTRG
jgi:hypothetical protein